MPFGLNEHAGLVYLLLTLAASGAVSVTIFIFNRMIIRPIDSLKDVVRELSQQHFQLHERLAVLETKHNACPSCTPYGRRKGDRLDEIEVV